MESQPTTQPPITAEDKPKSKKPKGPIILSIVCVIIALAGIGFGIYGMLQSTQKDTDISDLKSQVSHLEEISNTQTTNQDETTTNTDTPESTEDKVKDIVTKIYDRLAELSNYQIFNKTFGDGSLIKIPDSGVITLSNKDYGVMSAYGTSSSDNIKTIENIYLKEAYPVVKPILTSNGYTVVDTLRGVELYYNAEDDIYCFTDTGSIPYDTSCSSGSWITKENKDLVNALANASNQRLIIADPKNIKNSKVSPYQRLIASLSGAAGLFYRTSPDSDWVFFTSTQSVLDCNDYTGDIAKAFAGDTCYDASTQSESTVQP